MKKLATGGSTIYNIVSYSTVWLYLYRSKNNAIEEESYYE